MCMLTTALENIQHLVFELAMHTLTSTGCFVRFYAEREKSSKVLSKGWLS